MVPLKRESQTEEFSKNLGINEKGVSIREGQHSECVHNRFQHMTPLTLDQNKRKKRLTPEAHINTVGVYTIPGFH